MIEFLQYNQTDTWTFLGERCLDTSTLSRLMTGSAHLPLRSCCRVRWCKFSVLRGACDYRLCWDSFVEPPNHPADADLFGILDVCCIGRILVDINRRKCNFVRRCDALGSNNLAFYGKAWKDDSAVRCPKWKQGMLRSCSGRCKGPTRP